ncbi:anthranilate synthase component I [Humitalea sp. 24SJ18S-53]|uniref:anthranilate synthase component I n=1 Tax=Humitalea sp. 24SJ18S-53 TaxID=3422307 RepID=UPI003D67855C
MSETSVTYRTAAGIAVMRRATRVAYPDAAEPLIGEIEARRGALFASSFEQPDRYTRWDIGFSDPPLAATVRGLEVTFEALTPRGAVLVAAIEAALRADPLVTVQTGPDAACLVAHPAPAPVDDAEEMRSRRPTAFTVLRAAMAAFGAQDDHHLGFYGAFGYDLVFQFEPCDLVRPRAPDQRDAVLYLPDTILVVDHRREEATRYDYDFWYGPRGTVGMERPQVPAPYDPTPPVVLPPVRDHSPEAYQANVRAAQERFACGDLFEAVLSQTFARPCPVQPGEVFRRLRARNPAPYGALMNLGDGEFLVSASPEMYVRVQGKRVETCPISGTISRGGDALEDAARLKMLLNSDKDEAELTMCTDVDRNDKARICEPGSVRVIARRQVEATPRLYHTVDHVEGTLRDGFDALDAFLTHAWAVTVTGAPKVWAMRFVEKMEKTPRLWYGGAIGWLGFDGALNTGLTLRTARLKDGVAQVRAGATLLHDSDPAAEDAECGLKASALLDAVINAAAPQKAAAGSGAKPLAGKRVLLADHEDSFVHTLADYLRQTGASVEVLRAPAVRARLTNGHAPDLVVLSPGPGKPTDFGLSETIDAALGKNVAVFGVCLGLQGIVEHFGGTLGQLPTPVHGKPSTIRVLQPGRFFGGLPSHLTVGRYHSLFGAPEAMPNSLTVTMATEEDGIPMAVEHASLPVAAVQFHPESILSAAGAQGLALLAGSLGALLEKR